MNNSDLDWLARNVHEWPQPDGDEVFTMIYRNRFLDKGWGRQYPTDLIDGSEVTKHQWQTRRAELQNKPSWEDAPEWVNWIAQWSDGEWLGYEVKPECGNYNDPDDCYVDARQHVAKIHHFEYGELLGDWRDTLERRQESETKAYCRKSDETGAPKQEWTGPEDGLPPVGVVCEGYLRAYGHEEPKWHCVEILKVLPQECAVLIENKGKLSWCDEFRPLRTEEDKAVDEMLEEIETKRSIRLGREAAKALYRSGYRKLDKPDASD